jgi:hypothetical protein
VEAIPLTSYGTAARPLIDARDPRSRLPSSPGDADGKAGTGENESAFGLERPLNGAEAFLRSAQ